MVGKVEDKLGKIFSGENYAVVKKGGKAGDKIDKHQHPNQEVVFTIVKGKVKVYLNDDEIHELIPGQVLNFKGENSINAEFIEDGEVIITLINN
ncbi:MAG: DUF1637 domain-containing protein [Andreesenia angusta]|nr:DUF1637 domain-containing protein [Andreesenia angusta]